MKNLAALLLLVLIPASSHADPAFRDLLSAAPGIDAQDISLKEADPIPAREISIGRTFKSVAFPSDYDSEKASRLAAIASERLAYGLKGKCYTWVWKDLMAAGFPYESSVPDPSAYQFADWAKEDAARARAFGLKIIPTPDSYEEMPLGAVVVYAPGRQFAYGTSNDTHGHIEIITDVDGARYGCSDGCWQLDGRGDFLKTAAGKDGVTVLVPVR